MYVKHILLQINCPWSVYSILTPHTDRFMTENGLYRFSNNETDCDEGDRDLSKVGVKSQFINYSWIWKDNLWSITEVSFMWRSEGQIQNYEWESRRRTLWVQRCSFSHQYSLTPPCSNMHMCKKAVIHTATHTEHNLSYRDRRIDQTQINRGRAGSDRPFAALEIG